MVFEKMLAFLSSIGIRLRDLRTRVKVTASV